MYMYINVLELYVLRLGLQAYEDVHQYYNVAIMCGNRYAIADLKTQGRHGIKR